MSKRATTRWVASASAIAVVWLTIGGAVPAVPMGTGPEPMVCTWGGTPGDTTGTFIIKPGLTLTPSSRPLKFVATGPLQGGEGCEGKVTFKGVIRAGATCAAQEFDGKVKGLPGVARFRGPGAAGVVHEFLYDKDGNVVGADQPQVLSGATRGGSEAADCNTTKGFTHGHFSSVVEVWS